MVDIKCMNIEARYESDNFYRTIYNKIKCDVANKVMYYRKNGSEYFLIYTKADGCIFIEQYDSKNRALLGFQLRSFYTLKVLFMYHPHIYSDIYDNDGTCIISDTRGYTNFYDNFIECIEPDILEISKNMAHNYWIVNIHRGRGANE